MVPPPSALLYVILRHALLAALEGASLDAARLFGSRLFDVVDRDPMIANIGAEQHILRRDYLEVDAARLGLTRTTTALADWVLATGRRPGGGLPPPAERVAEVHAAITALADLPTARLERLLAEHLDLCSYRLDAWITALYFQRLASLLAQSQPRALHLGAFGWLENVRPGSRQRINVDALPPALRDAAGPNVFEDAANGGYVHAPSLMQAATAAVLRSGYLSHAQAGQPLTFAVNMSSGRVRAATALMEGVRAGQPIGALLGYQLERGLHEGHPGFELDQFIPVLRDRFPLLSGRLSEVPPGTSAEVIEARNVVDGLALVEATRGQAYPYGIGALPAAGTGAANAIASEVDRAHDALDAVADVLLAESVHQAVQGNFARTQASLQALTAPESPPEPEVLRTPRSGRVLAFRVALALDPGATAGWAAALSPRARANRPLNHWLSLHVPPPQAIRWSVRDGIAAPTVQSFAGLGLEPIDLVLMSGDRLGDQSSELERYLIRRFRFDHAVPDERTSRVAPEVGPIDQATTLLFDFSSAPGGTSLAALHPLLVRLRRLVTRARAAHAGDWRRSADDEHAAPADPTGSASGHPSLEHFTELTARLDAASHDLTTARDRLGVALAALAPLRAALDADPATIANPAWATRLDGLRRALFALVPFGIPEAVPADGRAVTRAVIDRMIAQGTVVSSLVTGRLARGAAFRATAFPDTLPTSEPARSREIARRNDILRTSYVDAARALLGRAFVIVPLFRLAPEHATEVQRTLATPPVDDALVVEEWLHSAARVRAPLSELTWALATTRWLGRPMAQPAIGQLPFQSGAVWIGGAFGPDLPAGEWLSLLVVNAAAMTGPLRAGLLLDSWTETVPVDRETTGVSFNVDRPNAVAPQTILVAVPAELRGHWTWDDLVGAVHEALDLAKLRAVEPDALIDRRADQAPPTGDYFQALPAILAEFTNGRLATTHFAATVAAALARGAG
jgi:hypothetical protein